MNLFDRHVFPFMCLYPKLLYFSYIMRRAWTLKLP